MNKELHVLTTRDLPEFMERPSITLINRVYRPQRGATGRLLRDLARQFVREGWQVTVLTTGDRFVKERDGAIKVVRVKGPAKPQSVLSYIFVFARLFLASLKLPKTHVVVTMTDPPLLAVLGRFWSWWAGAKHIHWCQDLYPDLLPALGMNLPSLMTRFLQLQSTKAMKKADKIIVIGRCMAQKVINKGVTAGKISVITNWPDAETIGRLDKTSKVYRVKRKADKTLDNGVKDHGEQVKNGPKFRVLYAGNIGKAHPVSSIIEAAEILAPDYPEIEFVFVGDGPGFNALMDEREKRGLENIKFLPYQPRIRLRETLESGDVHLISMFQSAEGLLVPSKVYSALAVGRPCVFIGPQNSEAAKAIHDFEAGSIVSEHDSIALANVIKKYRMDGDHWFAAHKGALNAREVFLPEESMKAWVQRAWQVLKSKTYNKDDQLIEEYKDAA